MSTKRLKKIKLKIWRQEHAQAKGAFETYILKDIPTEISFFEMLDMLNEQLIKQDKNPVAFEHDCREGICGSCGLFINGRAHGPETGITTCQLHMRSFKDGETIYVEPWRANAFPIIKDLIVDRSAFDRVMEAGGFISTNTGSAPEANTIPIAPVDINEALDAASCIGCGACVATCNNSSAMLFVASKISHLAKLPQGKPEAKERARNMVAKMDELGFGACSNMGACEFECPKGISLAHIARLNREYLSAKIRE